jgi:cell division protein FtsQ
MPAVARKASKPASRQAPQAQRSRSAPRAAAPYAPAKLEAARGLGVGPIATLSIAGAVVAVGLITALFTGDRLETFSAGLRSTTDGIVAGLGLGVDAVHVQGASPASRPAILAAAGVEEGDSILGLDLPAMRERIENVGWVHEAKVIRLLPDTVVIAVVERRPIAVWQHRGRIGLIDSQGKPIAGADAGAFTELPLVVGQGANAAAAEILPLLAARTRLMTHTEALVRVDGRRWDIRLKDGALIQLPALDVDAALIQLDQLDQRARVLELGFEKIDLRDPEMIAVRPRSDRPHPVLSAEAAKAAPAFALRSQKETACPGWKTAARRVTRSPATA